MGRYSLWVQVPLLLAATVGITLLSTGLVFAALHDAPPVAKFCGGFAFLLTVQWAWRRFVLRPWFSHVGFQRMLRQVLILARKRSYEEQPYD